MAVGDFDPYLEIFEDDDFGEPNALTWDGNTYDIVRFAQTTEIIYTDAGARTLRMLPVDVKIEDFPANEPTERGTVTLDGITYRIQTRRTSSTNKTYRLSLVDQYAAE